MHALKGTMIPVDFRIFLRPLLLSSLAHALVIPSSVTCTFMHSFIILHIHWLLVFFNQLLTIKKCKIVRINLLPFRDSL